MKKIENTCLVCNGTGWIWSLTIPGKRRQCNACKGTGQIQHE